jgi:molybdate transport system substrate-binding protein
VIAGGNLGAVWPVPADHHAPIRQDAILLAHGKDNDAARGFLAYLASDAAARTIAAFGYGTGT